MKDNTNSETCRPGRVRRQIAVRELQIRLREYGVKMGAFMDVIGTD